MAGSRSRWLGPKRRLREFGHVEGGTPRFTTDQQKEMAPRYAKRKGYHHGARTR